MWRLVLNIDPTTAEIADVYIQLGQVQTWEAMSFKETASGRWEGASEFFENEFLNNCDLKM